MIGTASRVELEIIPVTEVPIQPHGDIILPPLVCFECVWAGERLKQEFVALVFGNIDAVLVRWNDVETLLVVVVTQEIRLRERS